MQKVTSIQKAPKEPPIRRFRREGTTVNRHSATPTMVGDSPLYEDMTGRRIGQYRILRSLGQGGMGAVYLGVRDDAVKMHAAIKLVRRSLDAGKLHRRFLNERQILADLQHPNISRLLDAGTTEDQIPYLVMEYVDGQPIDQYCNDNQLTVRERIELFAKVCDAVEFAHRNSVIHRDLKPGNILVTEQGEPILLDFGIAKILDNPTGEALTCTGDFVMTPEYASPEQVKGYRPSAAGDVYALGVLLYELLTGQLPYIFNTYTMLEFHRVICMIDPIKPTLAVRRQKRAARDAITINGELDAVIMKALRKEPEHRYLTMKALAEDLRRYLNGFPVEARGNAWRYRMGKTLRRHKWKLIPAAALFGFFVLACCKQLELQASQQAAAEHQAQAVEAKIIADQQQALADQVVQEKQAANEEFKEVKTALRGERDQARKAWAQAQADREVAEAELADVAKQRDRAKGDLVALERQRAKAKDELAELERTRRAAELAKAEAEQARVKAELELLVAQKERDTSKRMISLLERLFSEAGNDAVSPEQVLDNLPAELADNEETRARLMNLAGALYVSLGRLDDARPLLERGLELSRNIYGENHEKVATSLSNLAFLHFQSRNYETAQPLFQQALDLRRDLLGDSHESIASSLCQLAMLYQEQGLFEMALQNYQQSFSMHRDLFGQDSIQVAMCLEKIAALYWAAGDKTRAVSMQQAAIQIKRKLYSPDSEQLALAMSRLEAYCCGKELNLETDKNLLLAEESSDITTGIEDLSENLNNAGFGAPVFAENLAQLDPNAQGGNNGNPPPAGNNPPPPNGDNVQANNGNGNGNGNGGRDNNSNRNRDRRNDSNGADSLQTNNRNRDRGRSNFNRNNQQGDSFSASKNSLSGSRFSSQSGARHGGGNRSSGDRGGGGRGGRN